MPEPNQRTALRRFVNGPATPAKRGSRRHRFERRSGLEKCDCAAETLLKDARIRMTPTAGCTSGLGDAGDRNPKG